MGSVLLPDLATEIVIPVCAVVGIVFSLVQWLLVSRVKLSPDRNASSPKNNKNGYNDYLIEEEESINEHNVVAKCSEIQNAISEVLNQTNPSSSNRRRDQQQPSSKQRPASQRRQTTAIGKQD